MVRVLQQGCFPAPMLQSPAIFLQQSISACVMCGLGRQASAGAANQIASRTITTMDRHRITFTCYLPTRGTATGVCQLIKGMRGQEAVKKLFFVVREFA